MYIFPAVDLYGGKAVRLLRGDYEKMTVYGDDPAAIAMDFKDSGAEYVHMVDLEGARDGGTPNLSAVEKVASETGLFVQVGGGVRSMEVIERYLGSGVSRVIIGTAAVTDPGFLDSALERWGDRIAVGADVKDGMIAIKGWTEKSAFTLEGFMASMCQKGVRTVICTDISRDGAMGGANLPLYDELNRRYDIDLIASGGVSSMEDVRALAGIGLRGAIIGKAYYTGDIDLRKAIEVAR